MHRKGKKSAELLRDTLDPLVLDTKWGISGNNRKAKYYDLTSLGRLQLKDEGRNGSFMVEATGTALGTRPSEV